MRFCFNKQFYINFYHELLFVKENKDDCDWYFPEESEELRRSIEFCFSIKLLSRLWLCFLLLCGLYLGKTWFWLPTLLWKTEKKRIWKQNKTHFQVKINQYQAYLRWIHSDQGHCWSIALGIECHSYLNHYNSSQNCLQKLWDHVEHWVFVHTL